MLATCICLNGSLLDQLSCKIVYLHNLFTCTFGRINMPVCLSGNPKVRYYTVFSFVPFNINKSPFRCPSLCPYPFRVLLAGVTLRMKLLALAIL